MMRVLIMSDSLPLPRETPEAVRYEETWVELLRRRLKVSIHQVSIGGATIDMLWRQYIYHKGFNPDLIIIQCGIVDCAPRSLTELEEALINSNRLTKWLGRKILPRAKKLLRKHRSISSTSRIEFKKYVTKFCLLSTPVFFIQIVGGGDGYDLIVPGINRAIEEYNIILKETVGDKFLLVDGISNGYLMSDFHHVNTKGHQLICEMLVKKLFSTEGFGILGEEKIIKNYEGRA